MLISEILKIDAAERPAGTLKNVIGDGLLLKRNRVYRNVRLAARKLGFSFVKTWPEYATSSLTQLGRIIETRKIPLNYNRPLLEELNSITVTPLRFIDIPSPVENHHLHEAAHCIAEHIFKNVKTKTKREKILKAMICESFANAVESMCCACADTEEHLFFLHLNSYMQDRKSVAQRKSNLARQIGFGNTFTVLFISFIYSNFLYKQLSFNQVRKALKFAEPGRKFTAPEINNTRRIMADSFKLSIGFRTRTNSFYINCMGIRGEILQLLDFDFFAMIENSKKWSEPARKLIKIVQQDSY